jgi:MerR family mercuric resistance operon transcriptional regulator
MDNLTTGKIAKLGGVNLETIRYYERRGLLPKPSRAASGYRAFGPDALRRLRFIKRAQGLGFSLREVKQLLALRVRPGTPCAEVRARAEAKIVDIDAKLRTLRAMKRALVRLAAACAGRGSVSACPILDSLDAEDGA